MLLIGSPGHPAAAPVSVTHSAASPTDHAGPVTKKPHPASSLPPVAAAAAAFVGDLQAAVADGQVVPQAGQDLFNHLQQLLFGPPDQDTQQIQQQYAQLVQAYDQHQAQDDITGRAATTLRHALSALGAALGAL